MSVFDRFRRNRQQSVLPDEVRQYYQSENRQRRGVAIGLAIVALIATIAVASALFFGGRFVYDQIRNNDDQGNVADTSDEAGQGGEGDTGTSSTSTDQPSGGAGGNAQGSNTTPAPAPAPQPAPAPAPAPATPNLGDEPAALPRTGDEGM